MTDKTGKIGELQKQLDAAVGELSRVEQAIEAKELAFRAKVNE